MDEVCNTYREQLSKLHATGIQQFELLKGAIDELERAKASTRKLELDLHNEQDARRRLQEEVRDLKQEAEKQGKRPFIAVLLDADADNYIFRDDYLSKGEKGGEDAADELVRKVREFMNGLPDKGQEADVVVNAFANVNGLGSALVRQGRLRDINQLREFISGFNGRQGLFSFIDVGQGKERADHKIRESVRFFINSGLCFHLILGCCHDGQNRRNGCSGQGGEFVKFIGASEAGGK
ncbi:hypothetical protein EDB81DRAFT_873603 [Dactylonectria macrodidyma]|uniref:DUF7923 domain-containing protein n=1 Tax=Dactylonectria macrodidyma TaxID=307937 RepID=A0A9P9D563_9HYPO|nr:hypothetical protein EDB81DRAFT_873603 [Dactylonectria macrodidyma]